MKKNDTYNMMNVLGYLEIIERINQSQLNAKKLYVKLTLKIKREFQ